LAILHLAVATTAFELGYLGLPENPGSYIMSSTCIESDAPLQLGRRVIPVAPRKIPLDASVYRLHSLRASGGQVNCDHDFNDFPDVVDDVSAAWTCARCGRRYQFEAWKSAPISYLSDR
jgi:hypothetical protein